MVGESLEGTMQGRILGLDDGGGGVSAHKDNISRLNDSPPATITVSGGMSASVNSSRHHSCVSGSPLILRP